MNITTALISSLESAYNKYDLFQTINASCIVVITLLLFITVIILVGFTSKVITLLEDIRDNTQKADDDKNNSEPDKFIELFKRDNEDNKK